MKNSMKLFIVLITILASTGSTSLFAQISWLKSANNSLYYFTDTRFTWNGGSKNGYCNGYGTIQWYNPDGTKAGWYTGYVVNGKNEGYGTQYFSTGQKYYEGNWKNDVYSGKGQLFYQNGIVRFEGNFVNGKLADIDLWNRAAFEAGKYIMNNIFDGGLNMESEIIQSTKEELCFYTKFNGNFFNSNVYEFVIGISKEAPYVRIVYANDLAKLYLTLKTIDAVADEIDNIFQNND